MSALREQYIVDDKGRKSSVIIPIKKYHELMEDLHDLAIVAERRDEQAIDFSEMKRRLKDDGLV